MAKASTNRGRELTAGEQRVLDEAPSGRLVYLSDLSDDDRVVSPEILRRLCVGTEAAEVDPRGIRIWGARVLERLELEYCTVPHPLVFQRTSFAAAPTFRGSRLPALAFSACTLPGLSAPEIRIELLLELRESQVTGEVLLLQARLGQLDCAGATFENENGVALVASFAELGFAGFGDGFSASGTLEFAGAKIRQLACSGATLGAVGRVALFASDAEIAGTLFLDAANVTGEVRLRGARIGQLNCSGATLTNEGGSALIAEGAEIETDVFLTDVNATGEVSLVGAKIGRQLDCIRARIANEGGTALVAGAAEIGGNAFLTDLNAIGAVNLHGTNVGGGLNCPGMTVTNEGGSALMAQGAQIGGNAVLTDMNLTGEVSLLRAKIGDDLFCERSTFTNEGGDAFLVDGAVVGRQAFLTQLHATGEVRFVGARIGGQLSCDGATFANERGTALNLYGAEIAADVFLNGMEATGRSYLVGTKIGGNLDCSGARLENEEGDALAARDAEIGHALVFRDVKATGGVDLYRTKLTTLDDDLRIGDKSLGSWAGVDPLVLEGLTYARFGDAAEWAPSSRSRWLRSTSGFQVGAWQQLITVYRAHGRDDEATSAAVAMHNDRLARAGLAWYRRAGRWILRITVGHGYRPWLAGIWALAIVVGFALVVWLSSESFAREKAEATGSPQPVVYAADTFLPIVDFGEAARWLPTDWTRWVEWAVILLGWALSTIFVAGFTRIVRS